MTDVVARTTDIKLSFLDLKTLSDYLVSRIECVRARGNDPFNGPPVSGTYTWLYNRTGVIQQSARGLPSYLAGSTFFQYRCSQSRRRKRETNMQEYEKTRNRRRMLEVNCKGTLTLYFPAAPARTFPGTFTEMVIEEIHNTPHDGRNDRQVGVAPKIRHWIRRHPRPTAQIQRMDLLDAISEGKLEGIEPDHYVSSASVHYWWKKSQRANQDRVSDDPWINLEHQLKQDPKVTSSNWSNYRQQVWSCEPSPENTYSGSRTTTLT